MFENKNKNSKNNLWNSRKKLNEINLKQKLRYLLEKKLKIFKKAQNIWKSSKPLKKLKKLEKAQKLLNSSVDFKYFNSSLLYKTVKKI